MSNVKQIIDWVIAVVFIVGLCLYDPAHAATTYQQGLVIKQFGEQICKQYKRPCSIELKDTKLVNAMTFPEGKIYLCRGLMEKLSPEQTLAVILHEVGHNIYNHPYNRRENMILQKKVTTEMLWQDELQADLFATSIAMQAGQHNYLPSALLKLTGKSSHISTRTHPSTIMRIKVMIDYSRIARELHLYE